MKKEKTIAPNLLDKLEAWCSLYQLQIMMGILLVFTLFSALLFNMRVSEGGDDSTYIIRAVNFIKEGRYPSFQGPVYPMFLSLVIGVFGVNLGILKLSSFVVMLASMWGFYKVFKQRIRYSLLFATLLLASVSSYYVYFTSQTYSEGLFILLQLPVFALTFRIYDKGTNYKQLLLLSAAVLLTVMTRTIGVGVLVSVLLFFILNKRYKETLWILGGFFVLLAVVLLVKVAIWQNGFFDDGQASTLMYKHPYQMDQGKETLGGFFMRFIDNSKLYLSKHFLRMVGLRSATVLSLSSGLTLLLYGIFLFGVYKSFTKNKYLFFVGVYSAVMLGTTFVVLQKIWDQYRLITPYMPFMIMVLIYGLRQLTKLLTGKWSQYVLLALVFVSLSGSALQSFDKIDLLTLRKNLNGDLYEGYTDDWRHYLSMAEYVGKELPKESYVAVRKPNMARIYGNGKKFYGIYRFESNDADALLKRLKDRNVSHVIMASLRKNPRINNGQTINTLQRYLYVISKKYPRAIKMEHQIGKIEPAYLFRIDYEAAK
ncbi:glycosyltransferase family 39 protein [Carboxylicivirga sp. M1479]|uniref:glycosyltransferase family 39 protein n=1 Tax=Carboxylicivirga sp. M1479 TaxID=2594476 RepID=UPI0011779494|nr:glycosyltransferase family 39 protein [Carboxylicivirga sp. M1479]TRX71047.1 hypothetical protein FNN09_08535 [Carboxylicivirga sp. M1479]